MKPISVFYCCSKVFTLMDDWEKFNEKSIPKKKDLSSHLNTEYITDADYMHAKCEDLKKLRRISLFVSSK